LLRVYFPGPQDSESRTVKAKATRVVGLRSVDGADTMELLVAPVLSAKDSAHVGKN
jgi:hypothetical protein